MLLRATTVPAEGHYRTVEEPLQCGRGPNSSAVEGHCTVVAGHYSAIEGHYSAVEGHYRAVEGATTVL